MENIIKRNIVLLANKDEIKNEFHQRFFSYFNITEFDNNADLVSYFASNTKPIALIFIDLYDKSISIRDFLKEKSQNPSYINIPVVGINEKKVIEESLLKNGITDSIDFPFDKEEVLISHLERIISLYDKGLIKPFGDNEKLIIPAIRISNLYKSYGTKEVLKGLNLEVYNGELFGFIGRNGIGKSTTIDCTIGVKKYNSGSIEIEGYSIKDNPLEAKFQFGYVASEPTCYESMTGYEYLEFIASIYKISEKEFAGNVAYLAKRLVLSNADLEKSIANYSHGMKQKLCLIASLLNNPDVWILDEPTVGLDIMAVEELKKMMKEYASHGKCVFITSHNIDIIAKICDRVAIINDGVVVELMDLNKDPNKRLQLPRIFLNIFGVNQ